MGNVLSDFVEPCQRGQFLRLSDVGNFNLEYGSGTISKAAVTGDENIFNLLQRFRIFTHRTLTLHPWD